jgi:hypothetical protein
MESITTGGIAGFVMVDMIANVCECLERRGGVVDYSVGECSIEERLVTSCTSTVAHFRVYPHFSPTKLSDDVHFFIVTPHEKQSSSLLELELKV